MGLKGDMKDARHLRYWVRNQGSEERFSSTRWSRERCSFGAGAGKHTRISLHEVVDTKTELVVAAKLGVLDSVSSAINVGFTLCVPPNFGETRIKTSSRVQSMMDILARIKWNVSPALTAQLIQATVIIPRIPRTLKSLA